MPAPLHPGARPPPPADAAELEQCRREIEQRNRPPHVTPLTPTTGGTHDERDARRRIEERHLVPEPSLPEELTVVGSEDDGRAGVEPRLAQDIEQLADAL